jgi:two-component system sensor histidine kinase/response regulator
MNTPTPTRSPAGNEVAGNAPARILVVDDQSANIQVVGTVLGKLGHEIVPATDGPMALKRLASHLPDLILLDLLMPVMDGIAVCQRLREHPEWRDIPVVFLSAADDKALEAGGVDYITKPFNQAELVSRVRTQLALKAARDRLARLAEDRDELLGILAHDLKNHLGGMQMSAQLLQDRIALGSDARAAQLAENILGSSEQLLAFVKAFLANAAADRGLPLEPVPLNLADVATTAVRHYQEAARRKHLELRTNFPGGNATVLADPSALAQILENLLSNAIKFSPPGRTILIAIRPLPEQVECVVEDQGPGFTDEDKARMFRRYGRLSARPTGGEPSSGLGLSIVRKLVQAMHGEITCASTARAGAAFTVRLPRPTPN